MYHIHKFAHFLYPRRFKVPINTAHFARFLLSREITALIHPHASKEAAVELLRNKNK